MTPRGCKARHRSPRALAGCIWPRAAWVIGDGPYVLLSHCRVLTVTLYETAELRDRALDALGRHRCGSRCEMDHRTGWLDPTGHRAVTE
jgi:hypothetical protein